MDTKVADKDDTKEEAPALTEEQRIEKLERNLGTSKTIMMIVALLLVMVISVGVTAFIVLMGKSSSEEQSEQQANIAALTENLVSLNAKLDEQNLRVQELSNSLSDMENQIKTSSNGVIISLLVEQEASNQDFLDAARSSIYDLAHMVPGSRTWLEVYSDQLDEAIAHSKSRQLTLKQLNAGGSNTIPMAKEDDGFGDF